MGAVLTWLGAELGAAERGGSSGGAPPSRWRLGQAELAGFVDAVRGRVGRVECSGLEGHPAGLSGDATGGLRV